MTASSRFLPFAPAVLVTVLAPVPALAGVFLFAENQGEPLIITHPANYDGTGGTVEVSVCIDETSESISEIEIPVQNAILRWNERQVASPNLFSGGDNNIPSGKLDFESVMLHEMGHCVGLAHPNAATESGLTEPDRNFTKALVGPDGSLDTDAGADVIIGSADDLRGDDVNLHWFEIGVNNPFEVPTTIDDSTMSVALGDLPTGHNFPANADRNVGADLGFADSEAVMQQGTPPDEAQHMIGPDDFVTLRLGMSGLDRTEGTGDDYEPVLVFEGTAPAESDSCDIVVKIEGGGIGNCQVSATSLATNHLVITTGTIIIGSTDNFDWFFNQEAAFEVIFADGFESSQ